MRTLYVSDLDGTLLRGDQKTSEFTNQVINRLVKEGVLFSYATARSYSTAHKVTEGMTAAFPVIVYNGAFIKDNATGDLLLKNFFDKKEAVKLVQDLLDHGISPLVYAFIEGEEKFSYLQGSINDMTADFLQSRKKDLRNRQLAGLLDCDRVIAFGDGLNDIELFESADEAYAVENAVPELKKLATAVIGSNEEVKHIMGSFCSLFYSREGKVRVIQTCLSHPRARGGERRPVDVCFEPTEVKRRPNTPPLGANKLKTSQVIPRCLLRGI